MRNFIIPLIVLAFLLLTYFLMSSGILIHKGGVKVTSLNLKGIPKLIIIYSPAFKKGSFIPRKYTCEGGGLSPPLKWNLSKVRGEIRSLALIAFDPDAPRGTFIHWLLYDIPVNLTNLPEGIPKVGEIPGVGIQGINGFGRIGYDGPCPPPGPPHRYFFRLLALDKVLKLRQGATIEELEVAIKGHILAYGDYIGLYRR